MQPSTKTDAAPLMARAASMGSARPLARDQGRIRQRYGPWAVVTGASDGIGREFASRLAEAGVNVVLAARRRRLLDELAAELAQGRAVETRTIAVDLATRAGITELIEQTNDLDVGLLVASAGFGTSGAFIGVALEDELSMVDVNCRAVAALSHVFGRRFVERKRGGIILMSSIVAFQGVPRAANYAATKAYVQSLAEGLRLELKPLGVDVIASAPGPIRSGFAARASMTMRLAQTPRDVAGATLTALGQRGTVRPGWLAKFLEAALMLLPRQGRVWMMGIVMAGMAAPPRRATEP